MTQPAWLTVQRGEAPLLVSIPHTGTDLAGLDDRFVSAWLARRDADWWIEQLYDFAVGLGATVVRTTISRSVIDVNRDPSGVSLYPGQATTELCPTTTFDGEPLYKSGLEPNTDDVAGRRKIYFEPYHAALEAEIARLRGLHGKIVLYDCHSIRSVIPRLFEGKLPLFNLGTNSGKSADPALEKRSPTSWSRRAALGRQRPLQGRLDHPRSWPAARRRPCLADGAFLPWLHAGAGRQGRSGQLAEPLRSRIRRADARDAD